MGLQGPPSHLHRGSSLLSLDRESLLVSLHGHAAVQPENPALLHNPCCCRKTETLEAPQNSYRFRHSCSRGSGAGSGDAPPTHLRTAPRAPYHCPCKPNTRAVNFPYPGEDLRKYAFCTLIYIFLRTMEPIERIGLGKVRIGSLGIPAPATSPERGSIKEGNVSYRREPWGGRRWAATDPEVYFQLAPQLREISQILCEETTHTFLDLMQI